jgi:hypothetical protein
MFPSPLSLFKSTARRLQSRKSTRPSFRRKPLFEALETRLLLSADPLATFVADGQLRLNLSQDSDHVVVQQAGMAADGGAILDVTLAGITQRYGDVQAGVRSLLGEGGAGDDSFSFVGVTIGVQIDGGEGVDELFGPASDVQWLISGPDRGTVASIDFSDIENLSGAAGNQDTFVLGSGGSLSGLLDGGADGFDSLVLAEGSYGSVTYAPTGPHSGVLVLDDAALSFDGLEPIDLFVPVADFVFDFSATPFVSPGGSTSAADQILVQRYAGDGTKTEIFSSNSTFEHVRIANPTSSLTIRTAGGDDVVTLESLGDGFAADLVIEGQAGNDQIAVTGALDLGGGSFSASAESITVSAAGSIVGAGDVTLTALAHNSYTGASSPAAFALAASIVVDGDIDIGGALTLDATVDNVVEVSAAGDSVEV